MSTFVQLWYRLAEFFLDWEMFQTKGVEKVKTHFMFRDFFFYRKSCWFWDVYKINVETDLPQII